MENIRTGKRNNIMSDTDAAIEELEKTTQELNSLSIKAAKAAYNLERSFVDNVKEISGKGWTAQEARERYGL